MAVGTTGVTRSNNVSTSLNSFVDASALPYSTDSTSGMDTGGHYMSDGGIGYIPEIWAGKLIERWYNASVIAAITSTDYEGLIKSYGDNVKIRSEPLISVSDYEIGQALDYGVPGEALVELAIDSAKAWAFTIDDIDKHQSDLNLMSIFADAASEQLKVVVDADVLTKMKDTAAATNRGKTAGVISGNLDLGTGTLHTDPLVLDTSNEAVNMVLRAGQALDEQNAPETGRWIVLPAWVIQKMKSVETGTNASSALVGANTMGDGTSILRNGEIGTIDRFTVYSSNQLPQHTISGGTPTEVTTIYAGVPSACAFARQIVKNETLPNPDSFGELMRGLQVYGYSTIKPEGLVQVSATSLAGAT